jgi:transposase-like protein
METRRPLPETLVEAVRYFADPDICRDFLAELRWPHGEPVCPECGSTDTALIPSRGLWRCRVRECRKQFSIKVGTIFEDSPIGLDKWLPVAWIIVNAKNGVSSHEIARSVGVTQKTAWFMLHRIRLAMKAGGFDKFTGEVEADETFIGGKARFMHKSKRTDKVRGTGTVGKTAVMGMLERHGPDGHSRVRTLIVPNIKRKTLAPQVREHVQPGSDMFTDALSSYNDLAQDYMHEMIDHAETYVRGRVHTNGLENFWSLLKRAIKGTYVSVEPFHLFRYLDEQSLRFNLRGMTDAARFVHVLRNIVGRRVTYATLTGAQPAAS